VTEIIEYAHNKVIQGSTTLTYDAPKEFGWANHVIFYIGVMAYGSDAPASTGSLELTVQQSDEFESAWSDIPGASTGTVTLETPLPSLQRVVLGPSDFGNRVRLLITSRFNGGVNPRWRFNLSAICK
jgi:hypothetical protein